MRCVSRALSLESTSQRCYSDNNRWNLSNVEDFAGFVQPIACFACLANELGRPAFHFRRCRLSPAQAEFGISLGVGGGDDDGGPTIGFGVGGDDDGEEEDEGGNDEDDEEEDD